MRSTLISTVLAAALAMTSRPLAAKTDGVLFDSDSTSVTIPVYVRGNLIHLRGRIGDTDSVAIVLDSGASNTSIDESWARAHGLAVSGRVQSHGAAGTVVGGQVANLTFRLPGLSFTVADVPALPLAAIGAPSGRELNAILGQPLLEHVVMTVDYAAGVLRFMRPEAYRPPAGATVLPLEFVQRLPYVTARITLPGGTPVEGRFVIDTGSSQCIILSNAFVTGQNALAALPATIEVRGRGVGGETASRLGRVERLELGAMKIEQPLATLRVTSGGVIAAASAIGNLGGELLRRFVVTFDEPHRRLILEPGARRDEPFEADMSGMGLRWAPDSSRTLLVEWVDPGSPVDSAGVRAGDRIASLDSTPARDLQLVEVRERFRHADEHHALEVIRGTQNLTLAFTTRRRI